MHAAAVFSYRLGWPIPLSEEKKTIAVAAVVAQTDLNRRWTFFSFPRTQKELFCNLWRKKRKH